MTPDQEHAFLKTCSHQDTCKYVADKVRRMRRQAGESQKEFAERAQVPLRTYKRFEAHGKGSLETFVQVLRAAGRAQYLLTLFPPPAPATVKPSLEERLRQLKPTKFLE